MSFLDQFLKESSVGRSRDPLNSQASGSVSGSRPDRVSMDSSTATATRRGMSIESDEGDVEDNRAGSIASSRSNMSEVTLKFFHTFQGYLRLNFSFFCSTSEPRQPLEAGYYPHLHILHRSLHPNLPSIMAAWAA